MKNDVHGVRSMLRQLLQYLVPWLFRRHSTIFRTGKKFERTTTSQTRADSSSETQGQIVGTRESLNGRENMARRKVKNGEKSPWGQCLTRPVPNGRRRSGFWLVPENFFYVLHFSSFHINFSARLECPSPPLSAPASPGMAQTSSLPNPK